MTELRKQARFVKFLESMEEPDKEAIAAARAELRAYLPSAWDVIEKKLRSKRGQAYARAYYCEGMESDAANKRAGNLNESNVKRTRRKVRNEELQAKGKPRRA